MTQPLKSLSPAYRRTVEMDYFPALVSTLYVSAGPNQSLGILNGVLTGTVSDSSDGAMTTLWTVVSGPGIVTITSPESLVTTFSVSENGLYVFRLTATSEAWEDYDDTVMTIAQLVPILGGMTFSSDSGTATLIGLSEYASPSVPPKKYLRQDITGFSTICYRQAGTCLGAYTSGAGWYDYSGSYIYPSNGGAAANTQVSSYYDTSAGGAPVPPDCLTRPLTLVTPNVAVTENWAGPNDFGLPAGTIVTTAPTTKEWDNPGVCGLNGDTRVRMIIDGAKLLTVEDTEADAIVRSVPGAPGTSNISYRETRGAGDFTFLWANTTFTVDVSNLINGLSYEILVDINTENYGGGGGVASQLSYPFVASGTTYQLVGSPPCAPGKSVTVVGASVILI